MGYHLQEGREVNLQPENAKELYNLRHSSARIIVECTFGMLKRRFRIHKLHGCNFSVETQSRVIMATAAIHNWLLNYRDITTAEILEMASSLSQGAEGIPRINPSEIAAGEFDGGNKVIHVVDGSQTP